MPITPRPELLSLLARCKEAPEDEASHLVLADWLDEHGNESDRARAEFVRLQCAFSRLRRYDPARDRIQAQGWSLLERHAAEWLGPLAEMPRPLWWEDFRRGLLLSR